MLTRRRAQPSVTPSVNGAVHNQALELLQVIVFVFFFFFLKPPDHSYGENGKDTRVIALRDSGRLYRVVSKWLNIVLARVGGRVRATALTKNSGE